MNREREILENWRPARLPLGIDLTLLDTDAFREDFSSAPLSTDRFGRAHLFEPNPQSGTTLRERYATDRRVPGRLAFADAVYAPANTAEPPPPPFSVRPSTEAPPQEVESLKRVCAEQLDLIEYRHAEAANA